MKKILTNKRESGMYRIVGVEESVEQELLDYFKIQFEKDQRGTPWSKRHYARARCL